MSTNLGQKWDKKIIVDKNDYKKNFVDSLSQFCRQYNSLNNSELDSFVYKTTKIGRFSSFFSQLQIHMLQIIDQDQ